MSFLFTTGFDYYSVATGAAIWNTIGGTISSGNSRWPTGQGWSSTSNDTISKTWGTNESTLIIGFAAMFGATNALSDFFQFLDASTVQMSLACTATGQLGVYQGGIAGTQKAATSAGYLVANTWHYFELKVVFATGATGSFEVRVDGNSTPVLSGSSTITATTHAYANAIRFGWLANGVLATVDDVYLINSAGTVNNDFLGDTRVEGRVPTGVGNYSQWSPSAGSNWQNVDEIPPDDDSTYNSTGTTNNIDSFAHQTLTSLSGTVRCVQHVMRARKDDAGTRKVAPVFRISATDYVGSDDTLSTSYQYFSRLYETSPATSTAWTISEVNNAEVGYKLTV